MKKCPYCSRENEDSAKFCGFCGGDLQSQGFKAYENETKSTDPFKEVEELAACQPKAEQNRRYEQMNNYTSITEKNIPLAVILSIVTCGIYGIYWFIKLNDEINELSGHGEDTSGGMAVLFSIITCGIYSIYWSYKMGEKVDEIKKTPGGSTGILYLILAIFGLGIVNYCLMQDTINQTVRGI